MAARFSRIGVARRKSPREYKGHAVTLEFDGGLPTVEAKLKDMSATGARVSMATARKIPTKLTLVLPPSIRRRCRLVWQSGPNIGIEFLSV